MSTPPEAVASAAQMQALGHPIRLRILEALRDGPSTASLLARELGESSGATSYHLRELARAGLVEDDPGKPGGRRGRERWWRRKGRYMVMPTGSADPEVRAAEARLRSFFIARDEEVLAGFLAGEGELGQDWREAAYLGAWIFELTAEQCDEMSREIVELLDRYRSEPKRHGAVRVGITFRALPVID